MSLFFDFQDAPRQRQDLERIGLADACMLDVISSFDPCGAWRFDIESGQVYWSRDMFKIRGVPFKEGPVDMAESWNDYHPEDRPLVAACLEQAVRDKTSFRFVMRLNTPSGELLVRSTGRFRVNAEGREELYGTYLVLSPVNRSIMIGAPGPAHGEGH